MISKELLKLVLPYPQNEFVDFIKVNDEFIKYGARVQDQISVYELAHKCKEWAVVNKYFNIATLLDYSGYTCIIRQDPMTFLNTELRFKAKTEPEAVFQACEWILKEINK